MPKMVHSTLAMNVNSFLFEPDFINMYAIGSTVLHTTVGPMNVYKKSEGQIM